MVQKSTANNFTYGILAFLAIGSIFADWAWIFSSEGTAILMFVIFPVYGTFIGIIIILQLLASDEKGEVKVQTEGEDVPEKLTPLKVVMLVFILTGALLSVLSVLIYEPGEGTSMAIMGAILAVIGLILAIVQASTQKKK